MAIRRREVDQKESKRIGGMCRDCKAEFLVAFSCKTRFCPSCHAKKLTLWSGRLVTELLEPVPHRMFTLTVPKRIRPFFLWERKLLGLLARCAAETIRTFYRHMLQEPGGTPGIVTSIQTLVPSPLELIARLLHNSHVLDITGRSYGLRDIERAVINSNA
jgi:hypothetical protein